MPRSWRELRHELQVGRSGVERVLEVGLSPEEERLLRQSAEVIRENGRA